MRLSVEQAGAADAGEVHRVVHEAFSARPRLEPPAEALAETPDSVRTQLARHGGLVCRIDGAPIAALLFDPDGDDMWLRRVAVQPAQHKHGIASALVGYAEDVASARGFRSVRVIARSELPETVRFWYHRGFVQAAECGPKLQLVRPLPVDVPAATPDEMRALGYRLASLAGAGDLVVLTGELGAGKTTLVQGLADGLGVRGRVTSPTFVIARVHRPTGPGPALVHADAYRLGSVEEVDDLDLDADLAAAVTAVEWGEGLVEGLADDRLDVAITRPEGDESGEWRTVRITAEGQRWRDADLRVLVAGSLPPRDDVPGDLRRLAQ